MAGVFDVDHKVKFGGFGPSILAQQTRGRLKRIEIPDDRLKCRSLLHDQCPLFPGVYAWLDLNQQICYVGKSKSLRKRLLTYFAKTIKDKKVQRIRQVSQWLVWEPMSDELLALIREQELIYRWRPEFNTQGQPVKRQPAFLVIKRGIAPHATFTRRPPENAIRSYGPIAGTGRLRAAIDSINQVFQLRDCPDKTKFHFSDQQTLFTDHLTAQCIRHELGSCTGPCAGGCNRLAYRQQVDRAIAFVEGRDRDLLVNLETDMQAAAAKCCFERATVLRDHWNNLKWLDRRMQALRHSFNTYNGILPVAARKNRTAWLIIKQGRLLGSAAEPLDPGRAQRAHDFLQAKADQPLKPPARIMDMNLQMILMFWFRKHTETAQLLVPFETAIEVCRQRIAGTSAGTAVSYKIAAETKAPYQITDRKSPGQ